MPSRKKKSDFGFLLAEYNNNKASHYVQSYFVSTHFRSPESHSEVPISLTVNLFYMTYPQKICTWFRKIVLNNLSAKFLQIQSATLHQKIDGVLGAKSSRSQSVTNPLFAHFALCWVIESTSYIYWRKFLSSWLKLEHSTEYSFPINMCIGKVFQHYSCSFTCSQSGPMFKPKDKAKP